MYRNVILMAGIFLLTPLDGRTWTNKAGKKIEASFVKVEDGKVTIKRDKDDKEFPVPLDSLSKEDQDFVAAHLEELAEKTAEAAKAKEDNERPEGLPAHIRGVGIVPAVKPNWDDPWPDRVALDKKPECVLVEENKEERRFVYHSAHYEFVSDVFLKTSVVREFAKMFEATHKVMATLPMSFDRARDPKEGVRLPIVLVETKESYISEGGSSTSAGFYHTGSNKVVIPLTSLGVRKSGSQYAKESGAENQTLAHELVHQLTDYAYISKNGARGWFTEGLAEYVSTSPYNSGGFTFKGNIRDIADSVKEYDYKKKVGSGLGDELNVPNLKKYMLQPYRSFTANSRFNYAFGMLLTTYFIHMDDGGSRKNLNAYLKAMREDKEGEELINILLAGRTWEELCKDIRKAWKSKIKLNFADVD